MSLRALIGSVLLAQWGLLITVAWVWHARGLSVAIIPAGAVTALAGVCVGFDLGEVAAELRAYAGEPLADWFACWGLNVSLGMAMLALGSWAVVT